jgi:hypothetical protein
MKTEIEIINDMAEAIVDASGYGKDSPGYEACVNGAWPDAAAAFAASGMKDLRGELEEMTRMRNAASSAHRYARDSMKSARKARQKMRRVVERLLTGMESLCHISDIDTDMPDRFHYGAKAYAEAVRRRADTLMENIAAHPEILHPPIIITDPHPAVFLPCGEDHSSLMPQLIAFLAVSLSAGVLGFALGSLV